MKFLTIYVFVFIPFCFAFYLIFGDRGITFLNSPIDVIVTTFRMILVDDYPFSEMYEKDPVMTVILVFSHLFISAICFINLMVALLSDSFQRVYSEISKLEL